MGLPSSSRNGAKVIWVTLHTAEGSRRASDLYNFFDRNQNASSHVGIDGSGFYDWVGRDRSAWTLLNGNPISVNAELCGFARWTREQWLSTGTVDGVVNPRAMVRNAAMWAKRECEALGIPKQYIGTEGVRARKAGVIIHWDYSRGTGNGDHWDTGSSFPFDVFFADMNATQEGEDMANVSDAEKAKLIEAADSVLEGIDKKRNAGALFGLVAKLEGKVDALAAKVDAQTTGGVDVQALANALGGPLGDHLRDSLDAVSYNALVRALNNTRGSVSLNVTGSGGL